MTIPLKDLADEWLKDPEFKAEYDRLGPEFEIATELIKARLRSGFSQVELAERMGTSQSAIARLESGRALPSAKTLIRFAEATGSKMHLSFSAA